MAFEPTNKKLTETVRNERTSAEVSTDKLSVPVFVDDIERTKNYTFSLQPSVRKQLDSLAREQGFKSSSKFLNELIKGL